MEWALYLLFCAAKVHKIIETHNKLAPFFEVQLRHFLEKKRSKLYMRWILGSEENEDDLERIGRIEKSGLPNLNW